MPVTTRGTGWGGATQNSSNLLVAYINDEVRVLEPDLKYATLGKQRNVPKGYDRLLFPQTNQVPVKINTSMQTLGGPATFAGGGSVWGAGASIQGGQTATAPGFPVSSTEGVVAITEGTNPTAVTWGATAYQSGPAQYGFLMQVSDLLVHDSAIEVVDAGTRQVRNALARMVDTLLQTVVNSGTNGVIYAGARTSRTTLGAADLITKAEVIKATKYLRSSNAAGARPFSGQYFAGIIHPQAMGDLVSTTQSGGFADVGRYTDPTGLREGRAGDFYGVRFMEYPYQNYYNSTVPVLPTTILSEDAFGWGYFQEPTAMLVSTPDSNNPLNLYTSISGKVSLGATLFEDQVGYIRIARIESSFSN